MIVIPISALAWIVGRDDPVPSWIPELLIPALSWLVLILVAILVVGWVRERFSRR
jgi:hypothetical protein